MIYKLIKLLGGYSAREYKRLDSHYDVLLSRAEDALEKEKEDGTLCIEMAAVCPRLPTR